MSTRTTAKQTPTAQNRKLTEPEKQAAMQENSLQALAGWVRMVTDCGLNASYATKDGTLTLQVTGWTIDLPTPQS